MNKIVKKIDNGISNLQEAIRNTKDEEFKKVLEYRLKKKYSDKEKFGQELY